MALRGSSSRSAAGERAASCRCAVEPLQQRLGRRGIAAWRAAPRRPPASRPIARKARRPRRRRPRRMAAQHRFEIARIDVEAAADDHVLLAIEERQKAVGVEAADVAGADEALAGGLEPLGLARLGGLAVIAGHHPARAADDFAGLAGCAASWPASSIRRGCRGLGMGGRRCAACRETRAPRACRCRRLRSCRRTRSGRPASAQHVGFQGRAKGALVQNFMRNARRSCGRNRDCAISRWYCTGTSIVCVARCRSARRR